MRGEVACLFYGAAELAYYQEHLDVESDTMWRGDPDRRSKYERYEPSSHTRVVRQSPSSFPINI
jgi:hypothetical protein